MRRRDSSEGPIPVNRLLLREVAAKKSALLTNESSPEGPRQDLDTATGPLDRSLMITPLIHIDSVLGLIQLEAAPARSAFHKGIWRFWPVWPGIWPTSSTIRVSTTLR